jgi:hypothetical protein
MALALSVALCAIYPEGHFDHVLKPADATEFTNIIQREVDAGKTLIVRWIASPK